MARLAEARRGKRGGSVRKLAFVAGILSLAAAAMEVRAEDVLEGCVEVAGLPDGARVEVDGEPVETGVECLPLEPGTYLLTVFAPAAPPFEEFVEVKAGETVTLSYEQPGRPPTGNPPFPLPRRQEETSRTFLGPALVGGSAVAGVTAVLWWRTAARSELAAEDIKSRDDVSQDARELILEDIAERRRKRRDMALVSGAVAGALLAAGGAVWLWASGVDHEAGQGGVGVYLGPGEAKLMLTVRLQ